VSDSLPLAQIKLASLQRFFGAFSFRDVLGRAKHFIRSAGGITFYGAYTVNRPNFAVGTNETMFNVGTSSALKRLLSCAEDKFAIFRVDHFSNLRQIDGAPPRIQPINAVDFVRPNHPILDEVPRIMANVGNALGFFKLRVAFLQLA